MNNTLSILDQAELRQLALNASEAGDDATAIAYMKEASSRPDADGTIHYLLGAHYAQIKMYDRAVNEMEAALALEPGLSIARFQLGLLWLTSGIADKALAVLAPLQELPDTDGLRHFGQGLCLLANDKLAESCAALAKGIELNNVNAPLNGDMQMMIDAITNAMNAPPPAADPAANEAAPAAPVIPGVPAAAAKPEDTVVDDAYHRHLSMLAYAMNKEK